MRGDEGNDVDTIDGYGVLNLHGNYDLNERVLIFFRVNNVLDRDFENFGAFGEPDEVLGDEFDNSRFLSPGSPLGAWLGVEWNID